MAPLPSPRTQPPPAQVGASTTAGVRFGAFQSRNFRLLWFGLAITNTGTWMATVAEGWLMTDLEPERKSFYVGLISLMFAIPMAVLPPIGGVLADRISRIRLLWVTQLAFLALNAIIAAITLTGNASVAMVLTSALFTGVILAVDSPTRHSLVPDLVPREHLTSAVSLQSASFSGATLVGSAVGGALIPVIGVGGVFAVNALTSGATLISLARMEPFTPSQRFGGGERVRAAMGVAFQFILSTPRIRTLLLLSALSGLLARAHTQLLPVFSRDVYHVSAARHGLLMASAGVGAVIGAVALGGTRRQITRMGHLIAAGLLVQAGLALTMAVAPFYAVGLVVQVVFAMTISVMAALTTTIVQTATPAELRARVMGFVLLTYISAPTAGAFLLGALGEVVTLRWAVGAGAVLLAVLAPLILLRNPLVMRDDALPSAAA